MLHREWSFLLLIEEKEEEIHYAMPSYPALGLTNTGISRDPDQRTQILGAEPHFDSRAASSVPRSEVAMQTARKVIGWTSQLHERAFPSSPASLNLGSSVMQWHPCIECSFLGVWRLTTFPLAVTRREYSHYLTG